MTTMTLFNQFYILSKTTIQYLYSELQQAIINNKELEINYRKEILDLENELLEQENMMWTEITKANERLEKLFDINSSLQETINSLIDQRDKYEKLIIKITTNHKRQHNAK